MTYLQMVASKRLQQAQAQVGEVVDIMRVNVEKVLERDQKLSELDRRADDLQEGASQFQQQVGTKRSRLSLSTCTTPYPYRENSRIECFHSPQRQRQCRNKLVPREGEEERKEISDPRSCNCCKFPFTFLPLCRR